MHVLLIVIKNTACLDFILPVLKELKENKNVKVSVLFCTPSRFQILRNTKYYSDFFEKHNIEYFDFSSFLPKSFSLFSNLFRNSLKISLKEQFGIKYYFGRILTKLYSFVIDPFKILQQLKPDVILFDNTSVTNFGKRNRFYEYFYKTSTKVFLLPHAPHHSSTTAFTPFDEKGEALPPFCEFWMPFVKDQHWKCLPEKKAQFQYIGYPGLDSQWLNSIKEKKSESVKTGKKNILWIIRRFHKSGVKDSNGFIFEYEEFIEYLKITQNALQKVFKDYHLIIKPHPSNNQFFLESTLKKNSVENYTITYESIYKVVSNIDLVISLYSTILLVPSMLNIPTILLNSRIQEGVHSNTYIKNLYSNLPLFCYNPKDLTKYLESIKFEKNESPIPHLRKYFPDMAIQRSIDRMGILDKASF